MKDNKVIILVIKFLSVLMFICGLALIIDALTTLIGEGSGLVDWIYLLGGAWFIFQSCYFFFVEVKKRKEKYNKESWKSFLIYIYYFQSISLVL